jgi:hypothetical protein
MKKETATAHVKIYPSTHRRLKVRAAKLGTTIARLIDTLEKADEQRVKADNALR